jgi:ADP-L-glycero-D-manno-heptose 6-epimerase
MQSESLNTKNYIIVTGSRGFIGINTVRQLHSLSGSLSVDKLPLRILGVDIPESSSHETASILDTISEYEYLDYSILEEWLHTHHAKVRVVLHNGACSSTIEKHWSVFQHYNIEYSQMLWKLCFIYNIPLLYASSASVYGDGALGFSDDIDAHCNFKPLNLYGKSKWDVDTWYLEQAKQNKAPPFWFGLRYFNVFGSFETHKNKQASMVYHGYNQIQQTGSISLFQSNTAEYPDGGQKRDFIFIDDIVDITIKLWLTWESNIANLSNHLPYKGCFVNLGTGLAKTWNELALATFAALDKQPVIKYIPIPESIANQYQNFTQADTKNLLNLIPQGHMFYTLQDGVSKTVQYLQTSKNSI